MESEVASLRAELEAKDAEIQRLRRALSCEQALAGVIDAALNKDDVSRYSRQMLLPGFGVQGQKALKSASVLIVGAGGLGCPCAAYLAAAGVGKIGIVDFDVVEKSNLHRQILHSEAKVGLSKVDSLVIALRELNSQPEYVRHSAVLESSNALDIIGRYQVVVDASDNAATRYLVNDACVHLGLPLVSGSALRWEGQLTVYGYRGGPCYRCLFPQPPPTSTVTNCSEGGVIGMVPGVIGCMQALEVVKILTGHGDVCSGKLLLYDGADARWRQVALRGKLPNCDACADPSKAPAVRDYAAWCGIGPTNKVTTLATWYEKERGRRGSRLGRWVPDPSLVTVEPGLPATFYLPRPCVADVLRLQGILCLRTRGAVGLRARVPAEVSGRDAAGGSAWSTAPTGPPGLPCEQRGAVGLRARAPADVSSRDVAAGAEPTHQLVAWLTVRTTQASSRRSNEPRYEKERGRRGSRLGRWVPDPSLVTVEPGLPATFYLPRPCVADVLRLQGILCLRTRGAVGLRARVPAEVSGRDAAGGSAWSTAPTGPPGLPCEQRGAVGLRARAPADVSSRDVAAGAEPTHQLVAWLTVRTTQASSRRSNEPR
ncbi:hypothetical protein HPB51_006692 [Rhipicephalus microplus]|uniref:THIF-type NAD/FAD binding fold domain-containing protein n=1 Tax=Rhipicephalus microplus TaxID=6941 RepID=A0A9J6E7R4_RHIMP|nr:hypothetical protein HPB51_006692 [Rhipicephalus microplus]